MMKHTAFFLTIIAVTVLAGCGGQGPQIGSMGMDDSSFGFGSSSRGTVSAPNKLASNFWNVASFKAGVQAEEISTSAEKIDGNEVVVKEISFEGERWEGNQTRVFAYFAFPVRGNGAKYPAIIKVHGKEQTADRDFVKTWAARGYAALSVDLPGHGPGREASRSTGPDMTEEMIFKCSQSAKESWLYPATCSVLKSVSFLANQQMVDPFRIGVVGQGWGGVIALIVNGIDTRIKGVCSVYGSGYLAEKSAWAARLKKMPEKERRAWIEAFDPSSYVRTQSGPVLFLTATGSTDYSLQSFMKTVKETSAERRCVLTPNSGKLDDLASGSIPAWFDWALKSGPGFAKVQSQLKANTLTVTAKGGSAALKAILYTRTESGEKWESTESKPEKGTFTFTLPASGPLSYFVSVIDDKGCVISSEVATANIKNVKTARN